MDIQVEEVFSEEQLNQMAQVAKQDFESCEDFSSLEWQMSFFNRHKPLFDNSETAREHFITIIRIAHEQQLRNLQIQEAAATGGPIRPGDARMNVMNALDDNNMQNQVLDQNNVYPAYTILCRDFNVTIRTGDDPPSPQNQIFIIKCKSLLHASGNVLNEITAIGNGKKSLQKKHFFRYVEIYDRIKNMMKSENKKIKNRLKKFFEKPQKLGGEANAKFIPEISLLYTLSFTFEGETQPRTVNSLDGLYDAIDKEYQCAGNREKDLLGEFPKTLVDKYQEIEAERKKNTIKTNRELIYDSERSKGWKVRNPTNTRRKSPLTRRFCNRETLAAHDKEFKMRILVKFKNLPYRDNDIQIKINALGDPLPEEFTIVNGCVFLGNTKILKEGEREDRANVLEEITELRGQIFALRNNTNGQDPLLLQSHQMQNNWRRNVVAMDTGVE